MQVTEQVRRTRLDELRAGQTTMTATARRLRELAALDRLASRVAELVSDMADAGGRARRRCGHGAGRGLLSEPRPAGPRTLVRSDGQPGQGLSGWLSWRLRAALRNEGNRGWMQRLERQIGS